MADRQCPTCGEVNGPAARVCGMCRAALVDDDATGDRGRLVTVVTSDLKGSTALGERLDPESLREVLNRYFSVMRGVFEAHGGQIEKIIGDAIVAVFGLPVRRDDDPVRAVEAAAETQTALASLNVELEQVWGVQLVNRTGVATGVVHFGRDADGQHVLIGDTMDESTAMEQNAPAQGVLLAGSTFVEVRDRVEVEDVGPQSPKGSDRRIPAFRLVAVAPRTADPDDVPQPASPGWQRCATCGEESPEHVRYCTSCGTPFLSAIASRDSRKTVTIVFANPKPETADGRPLTPDAFTDVMARYFAAMKSALEVHGGTVEKFIGDAVMAVFGLPVRHEDDALRAVRAAADMQAALPALNAEFEARYGVSLRNHIGVNTGEVIATGDASTGQRLVTGDTVNTAARLEQAAGAAEIIIGELTHRLVRGEIQVEAIEPLTLKGKAEPVPAYRFTGIRERSTADDAPGTPFVGREAEMARLTAAFDAAVARGRVELITLVGDAGVGKSRLIREFTDGVRARGQLVRGRCLPYGDGITFWPLAEVVRDAAGIGSDTSPEAAVDQIRGLLLDPRWDAEREAITDRVASMMSLSPTQFPVTELMWGIRRLLEALAAARPVVVVIDDIHSAEQTFLDVIDYLIEGDATAPILLLCSARHELNERRPEWAEAHAASTVTLVPLSGSDTGRIVAELLGDLDAAVRDRIAAAADGNPLYAEQIVSMLQETGAIRRQDGRWIASQVSGTFAIPATVQALVAARLDALAPPERAVVDPASVIGLSFASEALESLLADAERDELPVRLASVSAKQLVHRARSDEEVYRFGHLVIRDTAYGSLLKRLRADLHVRFVGWAERVNRERGRETEFEEILGYHLEQAYRYRIELAVVDEEAVAIGERAAEKLASAGRRAFARGDLPAAVSLLRRASAVLPRASHVRLELLVDLGEACLSLGAFDEAASALEEATAIAEEAHEERLAIRAALLMVSVDQFRTGGEGGAGRAVEVADRAIAALEPLDDAAGLARAWRLRMFSEGNRGHISEASAAAERVVQYATRAGDRRLASRSAPPIVGFLLHGPATVADAIARCEELLGSIAGDRKTEAVILSTLAVLNAMEGRFDQARELYRRGQGMLAELGAGIDASSTSVDSSRVERLAGDLAAAERELRRDHDALAAIGESYLRSTIAAYLSEVLSRAGDLDGALAFAETTREIADPEDVEPQVKWRMVRARVAAKRGDAVTAAQLAREGADLAAATSDRLLRAEALADLSEVLAATGAVDAAGPPLREALAIYMDKGDVVSADQLRERLAAVAAP